MGQMLHVQNTYSDECVEYKNISNISLQYRFSYRSDIFIDIRSNIFLLQL